MSPAKALTYAEITLGVHEVYEAAINARTNLTAVLDQLPFLREDKRRLEYALADREQEIGQQAWLDYPEMAQARMDKLVKQLIHADSGWKAIRSELSNTLTKIDILDADRIHFEQDIKIASSRLIELGGYLNYLAAVKQAASSSNPE